MKNLTIKDLQALSEIENNTCISLYMPTVKTGSDTRQNPITYKNQIKKAENILKEAGLKNNEINEFLEPAKNLIEDTVFWQKQQHGFAAFIGKDTFSYFKLPIAPDNSVTVERRFHIKPLIQLFTENGEYYLLSLDLNNIKLFHCTRFTMEDMDLGDFPTSIKDAFADVDFERQLSFHTEAPRRSGTREAQFFSHGAVGEEDVKTTIQQYLRDVYRAVSGAVERYDLPLILSGVEYVVGMYREVNSYPYLYDEWISGSPKQIKRDELHRLSWEIASPIFEKQLNDAIQIFEHKHGTGYASDSIKEIVLAAYNKRVDSLFFDPAASAWGTIDPDKQEVRIEVTHTPDNEELINAAVIHTLQNKGNVYSINQDRMPNKSSVAAIFRY